MATVIFPSLTHQVVISVFEILVKEEILKIHKTSFDFQFGYQEGIISILNILFGSEITQSRDSEWLEITEHITQNKLNKWCMTIKETEDLSEIDMISLQKDIKKSVEEYALTNPQKLIHALN